MTRWTDTAAIQPSDTLPSGFPDTWYARTLNETTAFPSLDGDTQPETLVIGGGLAGVNTALGLAERGRSVMLLEAEKIGFGASGRNGGFLTAGFACGEAAIAARSGRETARELENLSEQAVSQVMARVERYKVQCGPVVKGTVRASWFKNNVDLRAEAEGDDRLTFWDRETVREKLGTERYHAALVEEDGIELHPLNLTRGLARAAAEKGAAIHEETPAVSVQRLAGGRYRVETTTGVITTDNVIFCMSGYRRFLGGGSGNRGAAAILPITTFVMVTEPLGDLAYQAISIPQGIADTRFACDYYRPLPDTGGRILWGGRISTFRPNDQGVAQLMKRDMIRVYPMLKGAKVDFAWSGLMGYGLHKMPIIRPLAPGLWSCTGFGGHGLNTTLLGGEVVASAIADKDDRWKLFDAFTPVPLAGYAGLVAAQATYWWHDWKDELRIALGA